MIGAWLPEKEEQRRRLRRLAQGSAQERRAAGLRIVERLLLLPEWCRAEGVALYASLPSEPDTDLLFRRAREQGKRVFYPFLRGADRSLGFGEVEAIESLRPGSFRFREPRAVEARRLEADLLLLPGLGFDREGMRLGRGSGYYDRTLAEIGAGPLRIGLFFSWQELPRVAAEAHDERLDVVITEEETIRIRMAKREGRTG